MQDQAQVQDPKKDSKEDFKGFDDIKNHLRTWNALLLDHIRVERMGGLSNEIWKVTHDKDIKPNAVIYRKFGKGSAIVDRERENYILKGLAEMKIAPTYYGGDDELRIEKFVESEMLTPEDLHDKEIRRKLAKLLADLHAVEFEKLEKVPTFVKISDKDGPFIKSFKEKLNSKEMSAENKKKAQEIASLIEDDEIAFLREIAPTGEYSIGFSHNDLHSQNVIVLPKSNKFMLIDYEYSDYNYRGVDIANLFNESMIEYDTKEPPHYKLDESKYPSDEALLEFVKYYLFFTKYAKEEFDVKEIIKHDSYRDSYIREKHDIEKFNEDADTLLRDVKTCSIYTHYFWALWGVIMNDKGAFEFDYVDYAYTRFNLYKKLKKEFKKKGVPNQVEESPSDA